MTWACTTRRRRSWNTSYVNGRLFHSTGQKIGTITDVIHDPHDLEPDGSPCASGSSDREYLVPVSQVETVADRLVTGLDRTLITSTPVIHDHFPADAGATGVGRARPVRPGQGNLDTTDRVASSAHTPSTGPEGFAYVGMKVVAESSEHGASGFVVVLDEAVGSTLVRTLGDAVGNGPPILW